MGKGEAYPASAASRLPASRPQGQGPRRQRGSPLKRVQVDEATWARFLRVAALRGVTASQLLGDLVRAVAGVPAVETSSSVESTS